MEDPRELNPIAFDLSLDNRQPMSIQMKRRRFIRFTISISVLLSPLRNLFAEPGTLPKTPWDFEGPFYPAGERHKTSDLILDEPRDDVLQLRGQVVDVDQQAQSGLRVEIWQTDGFGRYQHARDTRKGDRWKEFLYYGEAMTQTDGRFTFRTYVPGAYGNRPAHIHYKIWRQKTLLLTSQFYFKETGGANNASKSPRLSNLQTLSLVPMDKKEFETHARIVV